VENKLKNIEFLSYIEINNCKVYYPNKVDYLTRNMNDVNHNNLSDPDLVVAELRDVYVTPDGFVFNDRYFISDLGYKDRLDKNVIIAKNNLSKNIVIDKCSLIGGHANYYHWLLNWLPRLFLLEICGFFQGKLLVNGTLANFQRDTLEYLTAQDNYETIRMKDVVFVKELLVPVFFMNPVHSPFAITELRRRAQSDMNRLLPRKLFISRKNASGRKIVNEKELFGVLKEKGYELVQLEKLTFTEQIKLFSNATHIVAPHGAGLVNMVFSRDLVFVVEIFNTAWSRVFWSLGSLVGAERYCGYNATPVENSLKPQLHDLDVDIDDFILKCSGNL
jgi:capsular polysaccharide biosynthesis protein